MADMDKVKKRIRKLLNLADNDAAAGLSKRAKKLLLSAQV